MSDKKFINDATEIVPSVNDSPYKRILAIGDVHASFDKLNDLWQKISVTDDDLIIFLGDYLYGLSDKNIETLQRLIELSRRRNVIFLRGNTDDDYLSLFDKQGKLINENSIRIIRDIKIAAFTERNPNLPQEIFTFLSNLLTHYAITIGGRQYFFCHAGIKVGTPLARQTKTYLVDHPNYKDFYRNYSGNAVIVVGHKRPQKIFDKLPELFKDIKNFDPFKPLKVPHKNILMLDTHAKEDGVLSCVDILSGQFWQSGLDTATVNGILFVCAGNSCRSPMAKYIMRQMLEQKNLSDKVAVDSAGCETHGGGSMSKCAKEVLTENKIPFDNHISKLFTAQLYKQFKCIIALDEDILLKAKLISDGDPDKKIRLFKSGKGNLFSVDDPFHTGNYRKAYRKISIGCATLLDELLSAM